MPIESELLGYRVSWGSYEVHLLGGRKPSDTLASNIDMAVQECELAAGVSLSWTLHGEAWSRGDELGNATLIGCHPAYRPFLDYGTARFFLADDHPKSKAYAELMANLGERASILFEIVPEHRSRVVDYPDAKRPFHGSRFYAHKLEGARGEWEVVDSETDQSSIATSQFDLWAKEVGIVNPLFVSTEKDALALAGALHYGADIWRSKFEAKSCVDELSTSARKDIKALERQRWVIDNGALIFWAGILLLMCILALWF